MPEPTKTFLGKKQCHELKTWPEFFEHIASGNKRFEIRKDDRGFMAGDFLWLREWCPNTKEFTGRSEVRKVGYVLTDDLFPGLSAGYSALSLEVVGANWRRGVIAAFGTEGVTL